MTWDHLTGRMIVQIVWALVSGCTTESMNWDTRGCTKLKDERELWREDESGLWRDVSLGCGGGGGGVVAVLHPILWIAACSSLTGCGGLKLCPIMSSSGMYYLTISSAWLSTFCRLGDHDGLVQIGRGAGVAVSLWVVFVFSSSMNTICCGWPWTSPWHFQVALSQATALLAIAAADYKDEKKMCVGYIKIIYAR